MVLEQRTQKQERVALLTADVFAVDEDARIGFQCVADAEHYRLQEGVALLVERRSWIERRQFRRNRRREAARRIEHFDANARRFILEDADPGLLRLRPRFV